MQQQKPPQLERSMKHGQRESRSWPNMTHSSCLFLREITRAEWDYNPANFGITTVPRMDLKSSPRIVGCLSSMGLVCADVWQRPRRLLHHTSLLWPCCIRWSTCGRIWGEHLHCVRCSNIIGIWNAFPSHEGHSEPRVHSAGDHLNTRTHPDSRRSNEVDFLIF